MEVRMLRFTPQARDHVIRVRREKGLGADSVPRFIRRAGRLALTFARKPIASDRVVDDGRLSTLVAASAADLLADATIDVATSDGRAALVVHRDRARQASGTSRLRAARATA
jgi:Fe-S cluster assembly iron-binding protein IscA